MQVWNLKEFEEWGLSEDIAAVLVALMVLEARQEPAVAAVVLRRRMVLLLDDGVVAGNPVVKKAAVGMVVLCRFISGLVMLSL